MWYDMGEFATAASTLGIAHNTGYPLLILLGKLFTFLPVGDAAYRVNLMSAAFTALAVAVVFGIIHDLTDDVVRPPWARSRSPSHPLSGRTQRGRRRTGSTCSSQRS